MIQEGLYCKNCDPECLTCRGVARNNCVTCRAGSELSIRETCLNTDLKPIVVKKTNFNQLKTTFQVDFNQKIDSTNIKLVFDTTSVLVNGDGTVPDHKVKRISIINNNSAIKIDCLILGNVKEGKLILRKSPYDMEQPLRGVLYSIENFDVGFYENIVIPDVNIDLTGLN